MTVYDRARSCSRFVVMTLFTGYKISGWGLSKKPSFEIKAVCQSSGGFQHVAFWERPLVTQAAVTRHSTWLSPIRLRFLSPGWNLGVPNLLDSQQIFQQTN